MERLAKLPRAASIAVDAVFGVARKTNPGFRNTSMGGSDRVFLSLWRKPVVKKSVKYRNDKDFH